MTKINLGSLVYGPHASLIHEMADKCIKDERIQAIWVGGSLAAGHGDTFSDLDFRVAVKPGQVGNWSNPSWEKYLPILPCGGTLMEFGEQALLHHLVLTNGVIVDFFVQDTERQNLEPHLVVIACRDSDLKKKIESFSHPTSSLTKEIDAKEVRQLLVEYWIITHKELKALARQYDLSSFVGLYWERLALLRAYHIQIVGKDITNQATLHMLGVLHKGLAGKITQQQKDILGLPSRTPHETIIAIESIRSEMARIGRQLAEQYSFTYPHELEVVVQRTLKKHKASILER